MKKTYYILGVLAAAITACSSNDDVAPDGTTTDGTEAGTYMNVRISLPGTMGRSSSRAATTGNYEAGTSDEYTVKSARFLFYDQSGNYKTFGRTLDQITQQKSSATGSPTSGQQSEENGNGSNIESTIAATVVLGPTTIQEPLRMITLLNYDETKFNALIGKKIEDVIAETTSGTPSGAGSFEMTSSAYVTQSTEGDNTTNTVVQYTDVPVSYFQSTAADAIASGKNVNTYVERTVAKVGLTPTSTTTTNSEASSTTALTETNPTSYTYPIKVEGDDEDISTFSVNDKDGHLAVKVLGWTVNGFNTNGYLVKHITATAATDTDKKYYYLTTSTTDNGTTTTATEWPQEKGASETESGSLSQITSHWNMSGDFRSFWAEDVNYGTTTSDGSWSGSSTDGDGTRSGLVYYSLTDFNEGNTNKGLDKRAGVFSGQYVYENTVDQTQAWYTGGEQNPNVTTMLIVGKVGTWDTTNSSFGEQDYVFRINGSFYTADGLKEILAGNYYTTAYSEGTKQTKVGANDIAIVTDGQVPSDKSIAICLTSTTKTGANKKQQIGNIDTLKVVLGTDVSLYIKNATQPTLAGNVANYLNRQLHLLFDDKGELNSNQEIECYKGGYCYYQVPIEQPAPTGGNIYGVVRNHSYALKLNAVTNIGDPIFDEAEPIVPIPGKDNYYYLGTDINVLEWRDVTQNVTL